MRRSLFITLSLFASLAWASGAHEHGAGRIDVVIDKDRISLSLELPLDALVGFERAPRSDKEKQALAAAAETLRKGAALFVPSDSAHCRLGSAEVRVPHLPGAEAPSGEHADAEARYVFVCTDPGALTAITTTVFKSFPRLYRLTLQRSGPVGQGGGRLTPNAPVIRW